MSLGVVVLLAVQNVGRVLGVPLAAIVGTGSLVVGDVNQLVGNLAVLIDHVRDIPRHCIV